MAPRPAPPLWIFGYGSLIFRPDFPHCSRVLGRVDEVHRRFWQASEDHRGRPGAPGRVVTLVDAPGESCTGVAFLVKPSHEQTVLAQLALREQGGYVLRRRSFAPLRSLDDNRFDRIPRAVTRPEYVWIYVGTADNPLYIGPEDEEQTARVIATAEGPSGRNVDYLAQLRTALHELSSPDPHVERLWSHVLASSSS